MVIYFIQIKAILYRREQEFFKFNKHIGTVEPRDGSLVPCPQKNRRPYSDLRYVRLEHVFR